MLPTGHPPGTPLSTPPRTRRPTDALLLAACRAYLEGRVSPTGGRAAANAYRYLASRARGAANVAGFCQGRALRWAIARHRAVAFDGYDEGGGVVLVVVVGGDGAFLTLRVTFMPGWKVQTIL